MKIARRNFEVDPESGEKFEDQWNEWGLKLENRVKGGRSKCCCGLYSRFVSFVWKRDEIREEYEFGERVDLEKDLFNWRCVKGEREVSELKGAFMRGSFFERYKMALGFGFSKNMRFFLGEKVMGGKNEENEKFFNLLFASWWVSKVFLFILVSFLADLWISLIIIMVRLKAGKEEIIREDEYVGTLVLGGMSFVFSLISVLIYWVAMRCGEKEKVD